MFVILMTIHMLGVDFDMRVIAPFDSRTLAENYLKREGYEPPVGEEWLLRKGQYREMKAQGLLHEYNEKEELERSLKFGEYIGEEDYVALIEEA